MKAASKPADGNDIIVSQNAISQSELYSSARAVLQSIVGDAYSDDEEPPQQDNKDEGALQGFGDDVAGMGYIQPPPHDDPLGRTREANVATEKLRKLLLGSRAKFYNTGHSTSQHPASTKSRPRPAKRKDDSDDEQEGRSAVGKKRKQIQIEQILETESQAMHQNGSQDNSAEVPIPVTAPTPSAKKAGGSYLDQILAERAAKKRKKGKTAA